MTVRARSLALLALTCLTAVLSATPASAASPRTLVRPQAPAPAPAPAGRAPAFGGTHAETPSPTATPPAAELHAAGTGLHWLLTPGRSTLVVDVVDTTGIRWPVRAASRQWATPHVRFQAVRSCRPPAPCVLVQEGSFGRTGWVGLTTATTGQMSTFHNPVIIQLNNSYPLTASQHQAVACHELGHALGLNHTTRSTSCLQPAPRSPQPDNTDRTHLEQTYTPVS